MAGTRFLPLGALCSLVTADKIVVGGNGASELFLCDTDDNFKCAPGEFNTTAPGLNCALDGDANACLWATTLLGQVGFQVEGTPRFYIGGYSDWDADFPGSGVLQVDINNGALEVTQTSLNLGLNASVVSLTSAEVKGTSYVLAGTNEPSVVIFEAATLQETARVKLNRPDDRTSMAHDIAVVNGMVYVANLQMKEIPWFSLEEALDDGSCAKPEGCHFTSGTLRNIGAVRDIDEQAGPRQLLHHEGSMFVVSERLQQQREGEHVRIEPGMVSNFFRFQIERTGHLNKVWGTNLGPEDVGDQPDTLTGTVVNFLAEIMLVGDTLWVTDRLGDIENVKWPTPKDESRVYRIPLEKAMGDTFTANTTTVETTVTENSYAWGMSTSPDGETVAVIGSADHKILFFETDSDEISDHTLTGIRGFGPFLSYVVEETDRQLLSLREDRDKAEPGTSDGLRQRA